MIERASGFVDLHHNAHNLSLLRPIFYSWSPATAYRPGAYRCFRYERDGWRESRGDHRGVRVSFGGMHGRAYNVPRVCAVLGLGCVLVAVDVDRARKKRIEKR